MRSSLSASPHSFLKPNISNGRNLRIWSDKPCFGSRSGHEFRSQFSKWRSEDDENLVTIFSEEKPSNFSKIKQIMTYLLIRVIIGEMGPILPSNYIQNIKETWPVFSQNLKIWKTRFFAGKPPCTIRFWLWLQVQNEGNCQKHFPPVIIYVEAFAIPVISIKKVIFRVVFHIICVYKLGSQIRVPL